MRPVSVEHLIEVSRMSDSAKTVHVRAYNRADGTYVREHWRSPPNR